MCADGEEAEWKIPLFFTLPASSGGMFRLAFATTTHTQFDDVNSSRLLEIIVNFPSFRRIHTRI